MLRADLRELGISHRRRLPDGTEAVIDFHGLRHTGLTLAGEFLNLREVQELADHASSVQTARYMHPGIEHLPIGIERFAAAFCYPPVVRNRCPSAS